MKLKIIIKTPEGQAKGTETKLRKTLLNKRVKCKTYTNPEDNQILWEVEGSVADMLKVQRNVTGYELMIKQMFENKLLKKYGLPRLAEGEEEKLKEMLTDQTTIEIIKEATAQELVEGNKPFWMKIKEKFKYEKDYK